MYRVRVWESIFNSVNSCSLLSLCVELMIVDHPYNIDHAW